MSRRRAPYKKLVLIVIVCGLAFLATTCGSTPRDMRLIQHTIIILKENRTFDHYFGAFPGADGVKTGLTSNGQTVPLVDVTNPSQLTNLCNTWDCALTAMNNGKMNGFDLINGGTLDAYTQLTESDIPNYWSYARHFVLADEYFTSVYGPSLPNELFAVAGQSGGVIDDGSDYGAGIACDGSPAELVTVIDSNGNQTQMSPCFDFPTLADKLLSAGISWKYYGDGPNIFETIRSIRTGSAWTTNFAPAAQFFEDVATGNLPAVIWLGNTAATDEHPPESPCLGENWTVEILNALMLGQDWNSTAVFITWDDFGGLYDHTPPNQVDQFGLGPRVPLLIISPYAKSSYIEHSVSEHSSILKFIETRYKLAALTPRDSSASDLLESFDFTQRPLPPLVLTPRQCQ